MLKFTGDISLTDGYFDVGFGVGSNILSGANPFEHIVRKSGDCWIGNFEGVASNCSNKKGLAAKYFRISPDYIKHLNHFDCYGFANNHAMQHGDEAYWQTVFALHSFNSKVFGTSKEKSIVIQHQNRQISLTGMCLRIDAFSDNPEYWHNPDYSEIELEVKSLPSEAFKVIFVHWGNEYINRPSSQQKKFAHWLIDAGFDLIIGMHPHVLQGYEDYHEKRIYYSLGNFVFDMASDPCKYGAIVGVDLSNEPPVFSEQYVKIGTDCAPRPINDTEVPEKYTFAFLNKALQKEDNSEEYHAEIMRGYQSYRKQNHKEIFKNMLRYPSMGMGILIDFIKRRL